MGICPAFSPQQRAIQASNKQLKDILLRQLKDLHIYNFSANLRATIPTIQPRYLLNQGIIQDIDKLKLIAQHNQSIKTETLFIQNLEQDLKNSCLILEDELINKVNKQPIKNKEELCTSFQKNLVQHQSLVVQLNILYQKQFQGDKYNQSLRFFLKWGNIFQEHCYGGFLKPLYKQFCEALYKLPIEQTETIVDEVSIFVQYMVTIYTHIYQLRDLATSENGQLFKNQNIYNLIMSFMFKRTKISKFVRKMIHVREQKKIGEFQEKLRMYREKDLQFFLVAKEFVLGKPSNKKQQIQQNIQDEQSIQNIPPLNTNQPKQHINCYIPYNDCIHLVQYLAEPSQTPITKLKIIVQISKGIMKNIYDYYDNLGETKIPELDPDNLTSIIMYLICRAGHIQIYEEIKVVQYFTTTNCLNCISGFYLNTFSAAIQSILQMN